MSTPKATVKRTPLSVHKAAAGVTTLQAIINTGGNSAAVQNAPVAKQALADLQTSVTTLSGSLGTKANNLAQLEASRKAIPAEFADVADKTRTYESTINTLAAGNAATITAAGLLSGGQKTPASALGLVKDVASKPGKAVKETIVTWPAVDGATSYAVQVNANLATPAGPFTALATATSRRRVIMASAQGGQILVQIAAVGSDGTQTAWCEPFLATAK